MLFSKRTLIVALFLLACLLVPALHLYAQGSSAQVVINYPELVEGENGPTLGLYFTVTDSSGRVVPDAKVASASVLLEDGSRQDATVQQPVTPFYIVLVLDASGSMGGSAEAMRQAAIQAINDAPEQAQFAIIRFNDKIDLIQEFTEDRNRAINAIGEVQPVNLAGTCLYDATLQAISELAKAPRGRRAIILFTDGRDETRTGDPCSTHVYDDVVTAANNPDFRVPINTIGLSSSQQNINSTELRNMASSTGGLSAIGGQENLADLFKQIMDALKSQWIAQIPACLTQGQHTATLFVTMEDGTTLQPAVASFETQEACFVPTATATPIMVTIQIDSVTVDINQDMVSLEVNVQGEEAINEYRFEFLDAKTNLLLQRYTVPAPLEHPVTLPGAGLQNDVRVVLRAFDRNGGAVTWLDKDNKPVDRVEYEFAYLRPTPTPPPATSTAAPISVTLNSISYDPTTDMIQLDLSLEGRSEMGGLEIDVLNAETNLRVNVYNTTPGEDVQISGEGLDPAEDYEIYVIAQSPTGVNLARSNTEKFTYLPPMTPTPTVTPPPTSTATEVPLQVSLGSIGIDENTQEIVLGIISNSTDRIARYDIQLQDSKTGLVVGNFVHTPPPFDSARIPLNAVSAGEYTVIVRVFGTDGNFLLEASPLEFVYSPPPTPTPEPTATPVPPPPPPPKPTLVDRVRDNPIIALVVAAMGLGLLLFLFFLLRPRKRGKTGTDFLSAQTGFYQMPAKDASKGDEQVVESGGSSAAATDIYMPSLIPDATLTISRSPAANRVGEVIPLLKVPFKLGRGGGVAGSPNDVDFDEDTSVSRSHAQITFENTMFYVTDNGSSNGTAVDNRPIVPKVPVPLPEGSVIRLGKATFLTLNTGRSSSPANDPNKTDYYRIDETNR